MANIEPGYAFDNWFDYNIMDHTLDAQGRSRVRRPHARGQSLQARDAGLLRRAPAPPASSASTGPPCPPREPDPYSDSPATESPMQPATSTPDALPRPMPGATSAPASRKLRIRDAAARLGVSEAELRATECGTTTIRPRRRLAGDPAPHAAARRGHGADPQRERRAREDRRVPRARRSAARTGWSTAPRARSTCGSSCRSGPTGSPSRRTASRACTSSTPTATPCHKVYAQRRRPSWPSTACSSTSSARRISAPASPLTPRPAAKGGHAPTPEIDVAALQAGWRGLARHPRVLRPVAQARRVAPAGACASPPRASSARWPRTASTTILNAAAASELPIMIFVGNPGCLQIHTGPVRKIVPMGPWINVLDPGFNLHLRRDQVARAFVVDKPTDDGAGHLARAVRRPGRQHRPAVRRAQTRPPRAARLARTAEHAAGTFGHVLKVMPGAAGRCASAAVR